MNGTGQHYDIIPVRQCSALPSCSIYCEAASDIVFLAIGLCVASLRRRKPSVGDVSGAEHTARHTSADESSLPCKTYHALIAI
ncbi:hypothetical protein ZHAS_00012337 [Anopheles sinensis]|uniref:Uncharacterized protein n=1 Tax=Anopheles sinensis TaxID=74873 RepID=A0A084W2E9_ANOSI|nr:hypothetical protein ZHAS_00012337 [Anopheles sinensis]